MAQASEKSIPSVIYMSLRFSSNRMVPNKAIKYSSRSPHLPKPQEKAMQLASAHFIAISKLFPNSRMRPSLSMLPF